MLEDIHKRKSSSKYPNEYRYNEELDCYEIIFNTPKTNGKVCLIDNEDYDFCQKFHWQLSGSGYVFTTKFSKPYFLHRELMGAKEGEVVDHEKGNTLDNRKKHLRKCTQQENARNLHVYRNGVKTLGVRKDDRCKNSYRAQIYFSSNQHIEKIYRDEELAIIQRLCWELMYFRDFAPQIELIKEKYPYLLNYFKVADKMVFNEDIETIKQIGESLIKDPHCPCSVSKNENTICPCLPCRKKQHCHCELFKPISQDENILKYKYPDIYKQWLKKYELKVEVSDE